MPAEPFHPRKQDWLQALGIAVALLVLYAFTAPRTVALEDDGLFVLSSYFLGIEHPPGYPLFTLIGHLFAKLPFGSVAYRVHLTSGLFGALTGASVWLCTRSLVAGRVPAYLAALGLAVSPVFWSQAIIAEVYTLNTFFFVALMFLALQACPREPSAVEESRQGWLLPLMALVFGLSLSNHWPLMLLVAPAFAIILWPARKRLLTHFGLLLWLVVLGLLPYLWLIRRSWDPLPISFYGPMETLSEIWFFVSRAGYANVDHSVTSTWLDRIKFFEYFGSQLLTQFAVAGAVLAAVGFVTQWRVLGNRLSAFMTAAFVSPSVVLLFLLAFDYSSFSAHVFHVYPLPSYVIGAIWMALGLAWVTSRYRLGGKREMAAAALVLGLVIAVGARTNLREDHEWGARYAKTILKTLPPQAVVFAQGEADLATMAYFQMIENVRPDITLYHSKGLVLGNRLFHPLRTSLEQQADAVRRMIDQETRPVVFTLDIYTGYARRERWLYSIVDKSSKDPEKVTIDIPEEAEEFFEKSVAGARDRNAWIAFLQAELRRRYADDLAHSLSRTDAPDARLRAQLEMLSNDFSGALGLAAGLMRNPEGYSVAAVGSLLDRARQLMPSDASKSNVARYFQIRGAVRASMKDYAGAIDDFRTAVALWPSSENGAYESLKQLYLSTGDVQAAKETQARLKLLKDGQL